MSKFSNSQEGEPEFFWQTTVKKKHGVIVIEDPDDASKLSVSLSKDLLVQISHLKVDMCA